MPRSARHMPLTRRNALWDIIAAAALLCALLLSAGCAMTTPKADFVVTRSEPLPADQRAFASSSIQLPNEWFSDNIRLEMEEEFQAVEALDGRPVEVLQRRSITYTRLTDPLEAAQVALARSEESRLRSDAIASAGATIIVEAIGAQLQRSIEALRAGVERAQIDADVKMAEMEMHHEAPAPAPAPPAGGTP